MKDITIVTRRVRSGLAAKQRISVHDVSHHWWARLGPLKVRDTPATFIFLRLNFPQNDFVFLSLVRESQQAKMSTFERMNDLRLLIVNDNGELRRNVENYLATQNICIGSLEPLEGPLVNIEAFAPGLVLLYHSLFRADGLGLLKEIRACSDVPVIMIAATGTDEADRIVGLELGADDCLITPFSARELLARIRAVFRRNMIRGGEPRSDLALIVYRFAGWQLHEHPKQLIDPQGSQVRLSRVEYALLAAFLRAPGRTLTREYLLSVTYASADVLDRTIDLGVYRLRRKLGGNAFASSIIATDREHGYRFCASVERVAFRARSDRQNKHDARRR